MVVNEVELYFTFPGNPSILLMVFLMLGVMIVVWVYKFLRSLIPAAGD